MRLKLIVQFSLVSSVVLLFTSALFTYFNIEYLKDTFLESNIRTLDNLSETIIRTTHHGMLEDNREHVFQMIQAIGEQNDIEHIRLINKEGRIIYSTKSDEINSILDKITSKSCNSCHTGKRVLTDASPMNRSRIFYDREGIEILGMAKGIYNREECSQAPCHAHTEKSHLLGVLDVAYSLASMKSQLRIYRNNFILEILFLMITISLCLTLLTQKLINQPLKKLLHHTKAVAKGDWKLIELNPGDEMGELADAFNDMTLKLKKAREERENWAATLETRVDERTKRLQEMQSALIRSEKLASLGELVAGIAHELNNPLTGILINTSMTVKDPRLDPELRKDFETIINETKRCADIVEHLLNFSRVSDPQKAANNISETIERTLSLVEHHADFHDILITKDYMPDIPLIFFDSNQIEQVFVNILVNASQAMPKGGDLKISTRLEEEEGYVSISLSDTGSGIAPENMDKLFDPFFSTKGHKGTGLGLSVSYGIVESHGGSIEVESMVGAGTTFTVKLPITEAVPAQQPDNTSSENGPD